MSDEDNEKDEGSLLILSRDMVLTELVVRVAALERILIDKGIFSEQELRKCVNDTIADMTEAVRKYNASRKDALIEDADDFWGGKKPTGPVN